MFTKLCSKSEYQEVLNTKVDRILGGDSCDLWFLMDGKVCCSTGSDENDKWYVMNFDVTLAELREKDGKFWNELFTNPDVNHDLGSSNAAPDADNVRAICAFMDGTTDIPPVTACGMENFVCDILLQKNVDLNKPTTSDAKRVIVSELTQMGMDNFDADSMGNKLAYEVLTEALDTCGENCTDSDLSIAFHRVLLWKLGIDED